MSMGIGTNTQNPDEGELEKGFRNDCLRCLVYKHRIRHAQIGQVPG